jgi:hypothetical protein
MKNILIFSALSVIFSSCTIWRSGIPIDVGQKFPSERIIEGNVLGHSKAYYVLGIGKAKKEALMQQAFRQLNLSNRIDSNHVLENVILDKKYSGFIPLYFKVEYLLSAEVVRYPNLEINNKKVVTSNRYDNILPNGKKIIQNGYYLTNLYSKIEIDPYQLNDEPLNFYFPVVKLFYDSLNNDYIEIHRIKTKANNPELVEAYQTDKNTIYIEKDFKLYKKSDAVSSFIQSKSRISKFENGDDLAFKYDLKSENKIVLLGYIYFGIIAIIEVENKGLYFLKSNTLEQNFLRKE